MASGEKRLRVGSVLGRSFAIWGRDLFSFSLLYAFVFAPLIVYGILAFPLPPARAESPTPEVWANRFFWYSLVLTFGSCLLWFVAPLAVIQGVLERLREHRVSITGCLRVYFTRLFPAFGTAILVGILTFLGAVLGAMVARAMGEVLGGIPALIPPILVACVFWVVVPVAAAERRGLLGSLGRSAELTRGSRARIFLVVLVSVIFQLAPLVVARFAMPRGGSPFLGWTALLLMVVLGSYGAVATSVAYHDLRIAKDGVGVEELARVFA